MLSSPLESPEGSALLGFGLGQGLPWGRSPWAGSWIGGSPPARGAGAGAGAADKGVTGDGDAGAGALSGTASGSLTEVQTVVTGGAATPTELELFGHLHVAVEAFSGTDVLIIPEISEERRLPVSHVSTFSGFFCSHPSVKCVKSTSPILSSAPLKSVNSWLALRTQLWGNVCCLLVQLGMLTGEEAGRPGGS